MLRPEFLGVGGLVATLMTAIGATALTVPTEVQLPGTQPGEVTNLESPNKCDNCHGGYDASVEPAHNWRGSMMAHASRDPVFWATLAVAEKDFDGSGDLCIRCHVSGGWLAGRSTPTDGSALQASDATGVSCDLCHKLTNPAGTEHVGTQNAPFVAQSGTPPEAHYGGGQYVLWGGAHKLGPYSDATARHQAPKSGYHRSSELCGTCHDVSNPVTGDLAHNNGAQVPLQPGQYSGVPGAPVTDKAAFKNPPYAYGVVERTFSEHQSSAFANMRVADYLSLPTELQAGSLQYAYEAAQAAGTGGNYADGTPRLFSCQSCHMAPVTGKGCNKNPPLRNDLPLHDLTGGNYWAPDAIAWLDGLGRLRLGGGLSTDEKSGLSDGTLRARAMLERAAALSVSSNTLSVINLTGHKLISGYPEGRRMWLNMKWYASDGSLLREDGAYGSLDATLDGNPLQVRSLMDLHDPNTRIYEAHGAMTQEWANQLLSLGKSPDMPLAYDRSSGVVTLTLAQLAAQAPGTSHETFHFVLNNHVSKDNRIPPYRMSYDEARKRNSLPVPDTQFGDPGTGGFYDHKDLVPLNPPVGATYATIQLLYQPISWEYIQFLYLGNDRGNAFLASTGQDLLDAWRNTGMAEPHVMATTTWGTPPAP